MNSTNVQPTTKPAIDGNNVLAVGFSIVDYCKCNCGQFVSPSEAVDETQILYDDKREYVVGFACWKCDEWIAFPKTYR